MVEIIIPEIICFIIFISVCMTGVCALMLAWFIVRGPFHEEYNTSSDRCFDCGFAYGEDHLDGCDVERCSACGGQRLQCDCTGHDKHASRWMGVFPYTLGDGDSQ